MKEFIEHLENSHIYDEYGEVKDAVDMLRQQADRIAELQDFAIWMTGCGYDFCQHEYFIKCRDKLLVGIEPTPQTKPLSDEEIEKIYQEVWNSNKWSDVEGIDIEKFARAIEAKVRGEK